MQRVYVMEKKQNKWTPVLTLHEQNIGREIIRNNLLERLLKNELTLVKVKHNKRTIVSVTQFPKESIIELTTKEYQKLP